jgi:hypothetical protein
MSTEPDTRTAVTAKPGAAFTGTRSLAELRADAARARAELAATLNALDHKLNLPKQIRIARRRITVGLHKLGEDNPVALAGVAVAAAVVAGTTVWLAVRKITDR